MLQAWINQFTDFLTQRSVVNAVLIFCFMLLIFVIDLQFSTEMYMGILYIIAVMLSLCLPSTAYPLLLACIGSFFTVFGCFYSIYNVPLNSYLNITDLANLAMIISVIWSAALICVYIKTITTELRRSKIVYKSILDSSIDPILLIGKNGIIDSASGTIATTLGWEPADVIGRNFTTLLGHDYKEEYDNLLKQHVDVRISPRIGHITEVVALHRMQREFPCELSINYIAIPQIGEQFFTITMRDISMRKAYEKKLGWIYTHDELTRLYNRHYFNEQIDKEWPRMLRAQEYLALLIVDVDFFTNYNDVLGPTAGDRVLEKLATCITSVCKRAGDVAARYGGGEFAILMPSTNIIGAQQVAINLQDQITELHIPHPSSQVGKTISVSMGLAAMIPVMGCSYERLIRFADQALYQAKQSGRNQFCIYSE